MTYGFDICGFLGDLHHAMTCRSEHRLEVFIWCSICGGQAETHDDLHCGRCGMELADQAPPQFYAGVS